ncbi:MAG: recombination mediator RecR [Clostridia bacterium]|nr:recombination mediator RecR [Clostridia bacterium]
MKFYGDSMSNLIEELSRLPGIGSKSAQRLAFYIINMPEKNASKLATSIIEAKEKIKKCSICNNISDTDPCPICQSVKRDMNTIMVVESPQDMASYEKIREYNGLYHVLNGVISPMSGIGPDDIDLKGLFSRVTKDGVSEVILATNPTVEGEATAQYIGKMLKNFDIKTTRIARGIPVGGDLEYVDEVTLTQALNGRVEL